MVHIWLRIAHDLTHLIKQHEHIIVNSFYSWSSFGVFTTVVATVIMDIIPNERRGEGISYFPRRVTLCQRVPSGSLMLSQLEVSR